MYTVYLDILICVNWIIDYFLLLGTAAAAGVTTGRFRLVLGAGVGGISALIFLLPAMNLPLQFVCKTVSGTATLLTAMRFDRLCQFIRAWVWFFLFNTGYSGLVLLAVTQFSAVGIYRQNNTFYYDVSPMLLVGCILVMYALFRLALLCFERPSSVQVVKGTVWIKGFSPVVISLLPDTGFSGRDFLLNRPTLLLSFSGTIRQGNRCEATYLQLKNCMENLYSGKMANPPAGWYFLPIHTATGTLMVPATGAVLQTPRGKTAVTAAFTKEKLNNGAVQGLISIQMAKQWEGERKNEPNRKYSEKNPTLLQKPAGKVAKIKRSGVSLHSFRRGAASAADNPAGGKPVCRPGGRG